MTSMVTNNLSDELFAPIVVTRVNDEYFLFNGADVTSPTGRTSDSFR